MEGFISEMFKHFFGVYLTRCASFFVVPPIERAEVERWLG